MTQKTLKRLLCEREALFSANSYDGIPPTLKDPPIPAYRYVSGTVPILISAPHATNHFRDGRIKVADTFTGSIAIAIAETTGAHVVFRTYNDMSDPNFYDEVCDGGYKNAVIDIIRKNSISLMLDIHGAAAYRDFDIDLGTDYGRTISGDDTIIRSFMASMKRNGIYEIGHNKVFDASRKETMANFIHSSLGIQTLQIEINKRLRDDSNPEAIIRLINGFKDFCESIQSKA